MSNKDPYRDQLERSRQKIDRTDQAEETKKSGLPPRGELHRQRREKNKWKLKYPVIQMLVVIFILLLVSTFSVYTYMNSHPKAGGKKAGGNLDELEMVDFERKTAPAKQEEDETKQEDSGSDKKEGSKEDEKMNVDEDIEQEASSTSAARTPENPASGSGAEKTSGGEKVESNKHSQQPKSSPESGSGSQKIVYHTVQPSETLFRISMKYYHSQDGIPIIREANKIKGNEIKEGQVLKIPLK